MTAFSCRRRGYKLGAILLMFSFVVFMVGYSAPDWSRLVSAVSDLTSDQVSYSCSQGLWMLCVSARAYTFTTSVCSATGLWTVPGWMHAVRVLECVCLLGLGTACLYTLLVNCCRTVPGPRSRFIELVALLSGVSGLAGAVVYSLLHGNENCVFDLVDTDSIVSPILGRLSWQVSWSTYVAAVSAVLAVIAAVVIWIFNTPVFDNYTSNTLSMTTMTTTTAYPVVMQGGHSFVSVVQGGNPYIYHSAQGTNQSAPSMQGANPYVFGAQGTPATGKDGPLSSSYSNPSDYTHPQEPARA